MRRSLITFLCCLIQLSTSDGAASIVWQTSSGGTNVQSDGSSVITADFVLEIGTFVDFVPTPENVAEWEDHWQAFARTPYNDTTQLFSGSASLETNAAPFTTDDRVFLWGRNKLRGSAEWVLVSKSTWRWPDVNGGGGPNPGGGGTQTFTFSQLTADDAILGVIKTDAIQLRTAAVIVPTGYDRWVETAFTPSQQEDAAVIDQNGDPDGDGRINLFEYVAGSDPNVRDALPFISLKANGSLIDLQVLKAASVPVSVTPMLSLTLNDDFPLSLPNSAQVITEADKIIYRMPRGELGGKVFFRVRVNEYRR